MEQEIVKAPSMIEKVVTLPDRSLRLWVATQEIPPSEEAKIFRLRNTLGWFAFSITEVKDDDVPVDPIEFPGQKSLSERLRNVLFVLHEKQGGKPEDFEAYRHKIMESLIRNYKAKISEFDN